jgi:hypothetical protein
MIAGVYSPLVPLAEMQGMIRFLKLAFQGTGSERVRSLCDICQKPGRELEQFGQGTRAEE